MNEYKAVLTPMIGEVREFKENTKEDWGMWQLKAISKLSPRGGHIAWYINGNIKNE